MVEGAPFADFRSRDEPAVRSDQSPRPGGRVGRSAGRRDEAARPPALARVRAAGHPTAGAAEQPAARAPSRVAALPAQTTWLIGREREIARVRDRLLRPD